MRGAQAIEYLKRREEVNQVVAQTFMGVLVLGTETLRFFEIRCRFCRINQRRKRDLI